VARVGDDGSIMLSKINSGRLSEPSTSTTISSNSSSTSRDGEGTSTQRKHWTLRHKIDAASMAAESGEHVSNSENRGLVLWTGGDSHQVLLAQQQERRHMELTGGPLGGHQPDKRPGLGLNAAATGGRPYGLSLVLSVVDGASSHIFHTLLLYLRCFIFFSVVNRTDACFP